MPQLVCHPAGKFPGSDSAGRPVAGRGGRLPLSADRRSVRWTERLVDLGLVALLLIAVLLLGLSVKRVSDPERLLVFPLGRDLRVAGPGIVFIIPAVDRGWRVDMDRAVPDWRSLDESTLIERLIEYGSQPACTLTGGLSR